MKTLQEAVRKVQERASFLTPVDTITRLDRFQYKFDGPSVTMVPFTPDGKPLLMHDLALRQLASRVGVPLDYIRRCPGSLAALNLNYWVQDGSAYKREGLLRTVHGNQVRALLSESYTPIDDVDIFPLIADALENDETQVQLMDFSPTHTHIRILFPRIEAEARPGDIIRGGLHISNSEVGLRSVQVESLVYRLVCANGLTRPERSSRISARHIGNPARIKDFIVAAVREAREGTQQLVETFKASVYRGIDEPLKLIEKTADDGKLTQEQFQRILSSFAAEGEDPSLFGVVNAFTHAAKAEDTVESRYQVERVGASLLRLIG